jgi:hypothetical protein
MRDPVNLAAEKDLAVPTTRKTSGSGTSSGKF